LEGPAEMFLSAGPRDLSQLPISPPSSFVITMQDERGRPPASPSGQLLKSLVLTGSVGESSGVSPGCWIPTNMVRRQTRLGWSERTAACPPTQLDRYKSATGKQSKKESVRF